MTHRLHEVHSLVVLSVGGAHRRGQRPKQRRPRPAASFSLTVDSRISPFRPWQWPERTQPAVTTKCRQRRLVIHYVPARRCRRREDTGRYNSANASTPATSEQIAIISFRSGA